MNAQILDRARAAYRAGDFSTAAQMFAACKAPSEVCGEADHLRGNSLMRLGLFADAAAAYAEALGDASYGKRGALLTNQGKALAAGGDPARAADCFRAAVQDSTYPTPYKAYMGLGKAMMAKGDATEAGVAFRQAAIDGANPAPAEALTSLAGCFVAIGRPADAVEAYRTALDFATPKDDANAIQAGMGEALAAAGRQSDAVDAFTKATADGRYRLTPHQQSVLQEASDAVSAQRSIASVDSSAAVTAQQPAAPSGREVDTLDPLGKSGSFMPDPSDTGFFTLSESEMVQQDKRAQKVRRKHRHTGLKVFFTLLILLLLAAGGLAFAYTQGLGYPSQQDQVAGLFKAVTDSTETDQYLDSSLSDDAKQAVISSVPAGATPTITAMDKGPSTSTADVSVSLSKGGKATYTVEFTREGIGWKVRSVAMKLSDADASNSSDSSSDSSASTDSTSTTDTGSTSPSDATTNQSTGDQTVATQ